MPLKKVKYLDFGGDYAYAPPCVDALINLSEVVSIVPCEGFRRSGPFVKIRFRDKTEITCEGKVEDFIVE
jgi:hypothetical protein